MPNTGAAYTLNTLATSGAASVTFSPDETRIYVAKKDGTIDVFDTVTRAKLATWNVGTVLGAVAVSEDGTYLLVIERFGSGQPQSSTFYRVETATGAVTTTYSQTGSAYLDLEIVDGHKAILTGGQPQVTVFDLDTQSYSPLPGGVYYSNNSVMVEDSHLTLLAEQGISSGPLMLFDDRTGTIVAQGTNYQTIGQGSGSTGFNFGHQAVSEGAGLVAQFIYHGTINLFDLNLHYLRAITISGPVDGLAFDLSGDNLYARTVDGQLNRYDVATGALTEFDRARLDRLVEQPDLRRPDPAERRRRPDARPRQPDRQAGHPRLQDAQ